MYARAWETSILIKLNEEDYYNVISPYVRVVVLRLIIMHLRGHR